MFRSILNGDTGALYSLLVFCTVVLWRDEKLRLQGADMKVDEMPRGDVGELAGGYSQSRQGVSRSFHLMGSSIRLTPPPKLPVPSRAPYETAPRRLRPRSSW